MQIVFHPDFHEHYTGDPAAARGRLEQAEKTLRMQYPFVEAVSARREDIARVHTAGHIEDVMRDGVVHRMAMLAAGGTLQAARSACDGQPAFALVRPPGHHASPGSCWGFCYYNNVAVAVTALLEEGMVNTALILDIDLHFGDGTERHFAAGERVAYLHPEGEPATGWMQTCKAQLDAARPADLIAVSAGFDRHAGDWGGLLATSDYRRIGQWVADWSNRHAGGRRFAVLEGGYNHQTLAEAAVALCQGMD